MFSWEVPTANQLLMFKLFIREPVSHATGTLATFVNVLLWRRAHGFLYSLDRGNPHIATSREPLRSVDELYLWDLPSCSVLFATATTCSLLHNWDSTPPAVNCACGANTVF